LPLRRWASTLFPYTTLFRSRMKINRTVMAPVLVAATAMATGGWFLQRGMGQERNVYANARLFEDVLQFVSQSFVDEKDSSELYRSEEHTSELQSRENLVCRL